MVDPTEALEDDDQTDHRMHRAFTQGCVECQQQTRVKMQRNRDRLKQYRELVDGRLVSTHPNCPHETYSGYVVYGCRCVECTAARKLYQRDLRQRQQDND